MVAKTRLPGKQTRPKRRRLVIASAPSIVRRSITLDAELDREAHALVGEGGFSAFVADALRSRVQCEKMVRFLDTLDEEYGPPSSGDMAKAEEKWQRLHGSSSDSTAAR
jgi:hypothetical protein